MKVLVTGGSGFIGSHIVDLLLEEGFKVIVVDNLSTGNLGFLPSNVPIYPIDICDERIDRVFAAEKPQIVMHQAAQIDISKSIKKPVLDAKINILGTINLLQTATKHHVHKFIYASTCASYGEPNSSLITEDHPTIPISLYGNSKYLGEKYVETFHRLYQMEYSILRYANVYGPRQGSKGEGGVVSIFLKNMLDNKAPVIFGDGKQTRDFVYVKDVARANVAAISNGAGKTMNISTGIATSILQLYEKLRVHTGFVEPAQYREIRQGDILNSCLDPTQAYNYLKWTPKYTFDQGINETIMFYRQ
ncbi:NAD-dependent epimerase/dehydratase family protein [Bacillus horti]|uniref:UDP-glucose 4-epimerase n=1 Tax=Caldalkalibacillus horti TaxID=77523 RepID=A0ABT9W4C5_9BACI|nr:NAD-dependent epimerase/dehydratase family protein [Bacillus horti]MDQ0168099.1 UDP-glucose 4-epimerase [Bacillus horti]